MPRASQQLSDIIDRLEAARERIAKLEETLREQEKDQPQVRLTQVLPSIHYSIPNIQAETLVVSKSSLKAEEEHVRQLHSRLEELNERVRVASSFRLLFN